MPAERRPSRLMQMRDFSGGMVQRGSRTGIPDKALWWCENAQIIGEAQIQTLKPAGSAIATIAAGIATLWSATLNLGGTETALLFTVNTDGSLSQIHPVTGVVTAIAPAGTVSTKARLTAWQDVCVLILDPTGGYSSWDGTTFLHYPFAFTGTTTNGSAVVTGIATTAGFQIGMLVTGSVIPGGTTIKSVDSGTQITLSANATGTGAQSLSLGRALTGRDLTVFEGRVWALTASRTLTFSAPASFTDFATADGGGTTVLSDAAFQGSITRILSALELLWIIGSGAIETISNVSSAIPPTFSVTNIVSQVGSALPAATSAFLRTFLFLAPYGVYAVVGSTPQKVSGVLDGLFPLLSFGADAPAATFALNNVFVWAVLATYNDPVTGVRPVLVCFSEGRWFLASQGTLTWITTLLSGGSPQLWGTDGSTVFQCFTGAGTASWKLQTKLWDFGDLTQLKQLLLFVLEFSALSGATVNITVELDNELGAAGSVTAANVAPTLTFTGTGGAPITFVGAGAITWTTSGVQRALGQADFAGAYLGLTLMGTSTPIVLSALALDVELAGAFTIP